MKKIMILLAALTAFAAVAAAQDREIDLNGYSDFSLSKPDAKIETHLHIAFPMYFGWSTLTNVNMKGAWATINSIDFLNTKIGQNFVYGLEMAAIHFSSSDGPLDVSLGLRWTFMDFSLENTQQTFRKNLNEIDGYSTAIPTGTFMPYSIKNEAPNYDGRKSKIHGNYLGIPLRMTLHYGKARIFAGASAEYLISGYTKYKHPKYRQDATPMFNRFRATVEGGFYWGILGVFANYSLTPLFPDSLSDAHTFTFGIILGR